VLILASNLAINKGNATTESKVIDQTTTPVDNIIPNTQTDTPTQPADDGSGK